MENTITEGDRDFVTQWGFGAGAALWATTAPIKSMLLGVIIFIGVDFLIGCMASYKRAKRKKIRWYFESNRAWNTIYKLAFSLITVLLLVYVDKELFPFVELYLPNMAAGFICGTEFWSFLENASDISEAPFFKILKKITKRKVDKIIFTGEDVNDENLKAQ